MSRNPKARMFVRGSEVYTVTPYNQAFIQRARQLEGSWRKEQSAWVFPLRLWDAVKEAILAHHPEAVIVSQDMRQVLMAKRDGLQYDLDRVNAEIAALDQALAEGADLGPVVPVEAHVQVQDLPNADEVFDLD